MIEDFYFDQIMDLFWFKILIVDDIFVNLIVMWVFLCYKDVEIIMV